MSFGGGGGTETVTTTQQQTLAPQQQELLDLVIPRARQFVNQPPEVFPGPTVAGFNPFQRAAQSSALETASNVMPDAINDVLRSQAFMMGPVLNPATNPALQQATAAAIRPIQEQFTESVLPNIRQEAVGAGQFGGNRQQIAEGIASRGFLRQVGDTSAQLQNQAYAQNLEAMTRAMLFAPQALNLSLMPAQVAGAVGDVRQQQEQQFINEAAQKWMSQQILPFAAAQDVGSLAFGIGGGGGVSSATGPGLQTSPFQAATGLGTLGFLVGSSIPGSTTGGPIGAALGALAGALFS
tara:strand:- start:32 stop:916 length:885 start_codon:yes stop_codon:yes gene_type:complete